MENNKSDLHIVISAAFWDLFTAGDALRALTQAGFEDSDLALVGVLDGRLSSLTEFCHSMGVPFEHARYYQACFEDGGALLMVRTRQRIKKQTALAVLRRFGALFPPYIN